MATSFDSFQKKRLRNSYVSVVVSIVVVLFMIGVFGLIILKSTKVANHFKEEVVMTLFLKDSVTANQNKIFQEELLKKDYTKEIVFVSKEAAAVKYKKDLGEDFLEFLGENPLKNGLDLYLNAQYVTPQSMDSIKGDLDKHSYIFDISYDKPLVDQLTKNINKISFWLLIVSAFFAVIAILLINSSIRLSIYAKRFNIKTMQMVGATKKFIRKPFLKQSIKLGMLGAFIAILAIGVLVYYVNQYIPQLELLQDYYTLIYVALGILIVAFIITWISTFFATQRFLNLQTDDLYY